MPSQREIADHLGVDESRVSRYMKRTGIDWLTTSMDAIRIAYIEHLRRVTAAATQADKGGLTAQRVLTARVDRELKTLALAEKSATLVNMAQLEPALRAMCTSYETELRASDRALKVAIDAAYAVDVDQQSIDAYTDIALAQLAPWWQRTRSAT
jgi:DNA-directed RNA polymerase subunit K/omega